MLKKINIILINISFLFSTFFVTAQQKNIFIPREFQQAVKNQTRSLTGMPGKNYWQNNIAYDIKASFNPETGIINGSENISYTNNSPNTINYIVINLYPDLFKKGTIRDKPVKPVDLNDGVKIKSLLVDNKEIDPNGRNIYREATLMFIRLDQSLKTGEKKIIQIDWECNIQTITRIRIGKYSKNTWFIGYWYPQIAVYDDIFAWDEINYDGLHEFYSPFANFDVIITIPSKQIIWATGIWQNPSEILRKKYLKRYEQSKSSTKIIHIISKNELNDSITKTGKNHSWHFKAKNVVDFAFATSDHYLWDALSLQVDKANNMKTSINVAFDKSSLDFYKVALLAKHTLQYLSDSMPAIPFPYPCMTVFNGAEGMEFPMMVNDGSENSYKETVNLTSHELSHTYFPFYMGTNQERYAWMDEGWAMFLPSKFQEKSAEGNHQAAMSNYIYSLYSGKSSEVPMMTPSYYVKNYEYYVASYYRPELAYRFLQDLLGKQLFLKALQAFIKRWNGKYPSPYDFFFTFDDISGQDLSWYWKPWFFDKAYPDLSIKSVTQKRDNYTIMIEKLGTIPVPIAIKITFKDGTKKELYQTAKVWASEHTTYEIKFKSKNQIVKCNLGNSIIPDVDKRNNIYILK